jgi:hypothetical protein
METTPAAWMQLANDTGGQYIDVGGYGSVTLKVPGGTIALEAIQINNGELNDSDDDLYKTRLSATYAHRDDFLFSVRSNTFLQKLATLVGMQDLEVGDKEFDSAFVVRANDAQKTRELFADATLRQLMLGTHLEWRFTIEAQDFVDDNPHKLMTVVGRRRVIVWERAGLESNGQLLAEMFEIFKHLLRRLCEIGSATPEG